jgi:hypothetical protein
VLVCEDALMRSLFGTDGVRGIANRDLTRDLALALGRAAGMVLGSSGAAVVVGRDTRVSGPMLQSGLVAGLCSAGSEVRIAGIVPSPAVAFLVLDCGASAGAMISASHNPVGDNGVKFFSNAGAKLAEDVEDRIESLVAEPPAEALPAGVDVGVVDGLERAEERYLEHLLSALDGDLVHVTAVAGAAVAAAVPRRDHVVPVVTVRELTLPVAPFTGGPACPAVADTVDGEAEVRRAEHVAVAAASGDEPVRRRAGLGRRHPGCGRPAGRTAVVDPAGVAGHAVAAPAMRGGLPAAGAGDGSAPGAVRAHRSALPAQRARYARAWARISAR